MEDKKIALGSGATEQAEGRIIDWIISGEEGRITAFNGQNKGEIIVKKRGDYRGKNILLLTSIFARPYKEDDFFADFAKGRLPAAKNVFLVFAVYNEMLRQIDENLWVIPAEDFKDICGAGGSKNNLAKYVVKRSGLGNFMIEALKKI